MQIIAGHTMKSPSTFAVGCRTKILGALAVATLLSVPATAAAQPKEPSPTEPSSAASTTQPTKAEREEWRKAIIATPRPTKGCFTATYPEKTWREIPCKTPPNKPYFPRAGGTIQPEQVGGNGIDFSAVVTGHISQAEGSFDSVTGLTATPDYSLQLNTDFFPTSTCSGSPNPGCRGWEQFVYDSGGTGVMQYWLIHYGPAGTMCPMPRGATCNGTNVFTDGWCPFTIGTSANPLYCAINAAQGAPAPAEPATSLGQMRVHGAAAGANGAATDAIVVWVGSTPFTADGDNHFPDLGSQWTEAEFNVFGDCCNHQAVFNSGASVVVRTEVVSGTRTGPGCHIASFTAESTNFTLVNSPPVSPAPTPAPALVFSQSDPAPVGAVATCADAVSLGDTHLTTFAGLQYDFQATGDFLLAETGPDFFVHTRQVSGGPTWPNASVNKAVAVQAGKNRVAICLPARVVIDGKSVSIRDGRPLGLSGGGVVIRKGNEYRVFGPSGDSIRANIETFGTPHIDVSVGLGRWPNNNARGLLANADDNVNQIAARDGVVLTSPFGHETLYGHFAESWRVVARPSILSACGEGVKGAVPRKPFFVEDLPPDLAKRNRDICMRAGIKEGPLQDACIIDVAMLGRGAAKVFAGRPIPIAVGDARKK
jgi:von Willebrand factor type D domain